MVAASNAHKSEANSLFASGKYDAALTKYDEALAVCPNYLDYELAVLSSNVAVCHLKLSEWKQAVTAATSALDGLGRLTTAIDEKEAADKKAKDEEDAVEVEIVSAGAAKAGPSIPNPDDAAADAVRRKQQDDIARIRAKALMRRARARSELGGWSNLEGALADYKQLAATPPSANLGTADKRIVQAQLRVLPPRAKAAQEAETAEMWGKLKDLGNGLLKPFGLSTENFKMVQDEKTGGYSMNFAGSGGSTGADKGKTSESTDA
ncbi:hypothetical protein B0T25DRAFT_205965 [Lasiosphaeria hispida]|uniref:Tetratricopeptide repeat protein 1 n=1 Tax=Lasiosphaeria hispida TaxID=260671 RepID=A0AAJ0HIB5_9PEZI|nr:hypothetical protein B0T25DRAFT_205965 [Lasiosphaeria hispida]